MVGFQILQCLKTFVTDFSGAKKARELKVLISIDNDWMYHVDQNKGQGSITPGDMYNYYNFITILHRKRRNNQVHKVSLF